MPLTLRQWEDSLRQPALCELLPVRDYLDGCIIRTNGCFVAGYEAVGLNTFFHSDETRNRTKETLEALVRTLPERSMRMQVRYEVTEGHGDLTERYVREQRIENPVLQALDRERPVVREITFANDFDPSCAAVRSRLRGRFAMLWLRKRFLVNGR
jgi:hypothetical protein